MKYGQYGLAPLPNAGAHSPRAHSPLDDVDSDLRRALRARRYTAAVTRSEIAGVGNLASQQRKGF